MRNDQYDIEEPAAGGNALEGIDLNKVLLTLKKNIWWVFFIILFTNTLAYLYIRYTRPVYESTSTIRLDIKSEANILGFGNLNQNLDIMAGEIELLKSNLFFTRVVDAIDFEISYYAYGRVLYQERYQNSPFRVEYQLNDRSFYDKPIDVEIINNEQFILSYGIGGERFSRAYEFGEEIAHPSYRFVLTLTENYRPDLKGSAYYFTINSDQSLESYLASNMIVEAVNFKANTIKVGFQGYDKQKIRDLVTVIDSVYLEYTKEKKNQATEQKLQFLDEQLGTIEDRLSTYENYFENFTIDNKTNNLQSEIGKTIVKMEELDVRKFQIQNTLEAIGKLRNKVENEELIITEPTSFVEYPNDVLKYVQQLNELLNQRELTLSSYKESSIAVKLKDQKIGLLKQDISGLIQSYDTQLNVQLEEIDDKKQEIEDEFVQLPSKGTQFGKNERYYNLYESIFLSLIQKKNELEIAKAGTVTDFVVLLPATMPGAPVAPEKFMVLGIGAFSGIILSLMFLVVGYVLNDKISSQSELEKLTSAPILGAIPLNANKKVVQGLVVDKASKSPISEAFRSVRTNMQFMGLRNDKKVVSVTSTVSAEGKTFVVGNLAYVIALSGQKVIIVDVDLRRPKIHDLFSVKNGEKGVSTHLIGKYSLEDCIISTGVDRLDIINAGPIPPNPSELIVNQAFNSMLEKLKEMYDVVILDTPPVGLVTDGVLVMEHADIPLYVFRADYSRRNFVRTLTKLQKNKNFTNLAIVINGISPTSDRSYANSKYGHAYYSREPKEEGTLSKLKSFLNLKPRN